MGATSHINIIKVAQGRHKNAQGESYRRATTIGMLPDNVLLETFDLYQMSHVYSFRPAWDWHLLVHVCRRWRQIIFESPHRLNLQILCTYGTPVRRSLDIWPAFPIVLDYGFPRSTSSKPIDEDNVVAALEQPDRISDVMFYVTGLQLGRMATVMQEPFPVLTRLHIRSDDKNAPVLPAEFLGGSAPCLQKIYLEGVPFPALPTLLLSASDLVTLELRYIPPTGYVSPEAMVASLAALPGLEVFIIEFQSAASRPDLTRPPPVTRTVLPALTSFEFRGASEYLEYLVARIDGPQLDRISIDYLNQLVDFQVAEFSRFIERSVGPKLTLFRRADVRFFGHWVAFDMHRHASASQPSSEWLPFEIMISCKGIDWQVSHMAQVLSHFSATLSNVAHLRLELEPAGRRLENTDEVEWLHLLHRFSTVRTLHVSQELAGHVALVLEDITAEMVVDVLPSLDLIRLVDQPASSIEKFVAARRLSDRPVTVVNTRTEYDRQLKSYVSQDNDPLQLRPL